MDLTEAKLKRHLSQMLLGKEKLPMVEREHIVRHLKGFLSTIGEIVEEEMLKKPS